MGLTEPFHPNSFRVSLTVSNRTTLQDEPSPPRCPYTQPHQHFHTTYTWSVTLLSTLFRVRGSHWQRSYSVMRAPAARTCCPGKAAWGEEAEVWSAAVIPPPEGMTVFPTPAPVRWPAWLVPAKGWPAAVRGHRRLAYAAFLLITDTCTRMVDIVWALSFEHFLCIDEAAVTPQQKTVCITAGHI